MTSFSLKVTRFGLGLLGRIDPNTAGRTAFRIFCRTPSRKPKNKAYAARLQQASNELRQAKRLDLIIDRGFIATYLFEPDVYVGRTSLVVHGWGSRSADMMTIIRELVARGERVVSIDLPGHGASAGRTLNMIQAIAAVDVAWRQYGPFNSMIGHSFGGAVVVNAAAGSLGCYQSHRPTKLVTIASPHSMAGVFDGFGKVLGLDRDVRNAMKEQVRYIAARPITDFDTDVHLRRMRIPTLVIHAHDDKEVPAICAEMAGRAGSHVKVHWADGLGHRRIIASTEVASLVADYLYDAPKLRLVA
ncbi:alpha/beta fold hydrolase [Brucella anthropi]|uniref:alpha/beta fold hydrolase n=1 Tax=Brucella anthropi TaxID=529 RepID=UPI00235E2DE6|nr:alpha/beta hydrolase [Brucella anthropi]